MSAYVMHVSHLFTDDEGTKTPPPSPVEGDFVSGTMM